MFEFPPLFPADPKAWSRNNKELQRLWKYIVRLKQNVLTHFIGLQFLTLIQDGWYIICVELEQFKKKYIPTKMQHLYWFIKAKNVKEAEWSTKYSSDLS